jgi:hypothetical protein
MSLRLSTATRNAIMTNTGLQTLFNYGVIRIFSGPQPASADAPATGTHLGSITTNGLTFIPGEVSGGLQFALTASGKLERLPGAYWYLKGLNTGTAGWFRLFRNAYDPNTQSTSYARIDGLIGTDLLLSNTSITPSTNQLVDGFYLYLPTE